MKRLKDPSILMQLILLIAVTTLIPVIVLGFNTYNTYKQNMQSSIITTNFDTLNQAEQNISNMVKATSTSINHYDNNKTIEEYLTTTYTSEYEKLKNIRFIEDQLQSYLAITNLTYMDIILVGNNDTFYAVSNNSPRISVSNIKRTYWYEQTLENPDQLSWFIFDRSYFNNDINHPVMVATKDLFNHDTGLKYGTIIIEIDEYYVYDLYKDIVGDDEHFMIQDSSGNIITTSDRFVQLSLNSAYSIIDIEHENLIYDYNYKDQSYIYLSQRSSISDWTFIKLLSNNKIENELKDFQKNFVVIYIICVFLILTGVFIVALRITKPIQTLTTKIQNNYLHDSYSKNTSSPSNLSNAMKSYELLIEEVDETVHKLLENNEARIDAEVYALRMQINPHFLYNTLNSIKYLVFMDKINLIEPTITSLVKLLQQTIRKPTEFILLYEELKLLEHYVFIQNIRTENSIKINYNIPKADQNIKVPSLFLQPIIENAIFHGIEPLGHPGVITISTYHEGDDLLIEVVDNGVGMSQDKINEILSTAKDEVHKGFNGIGLYNIHQRLKIYYGDTYGLKISSQKNIGSSVTIKIKS